MYAESMELFSLIINLAAELAKLARTLDRRHTFHGLTCTIPAWSKYSCGFPMVIFQQPTQAFFTVD